MRPIRTIVAASALLFCAANARAISPAAGAASATDAAGNRYATFIVSYASGSVVEVGKIASGATTPAWTRSFSLGAVNTTGGIAADAAGNTYTAVNGLTTATAALVKYDTNGVFVSSQAVPFQGPAYSPLVTDVIIDTAAGRVYIDLTFVDPSHNSLTSAAAASYDLALNALRNQIVDDGPGIADESSGMILDAAGDVGMGVTMQAAGSSTATYDVAWFVSGLIRLSSRVAASAPLDMCCIDCVNVQYVGGDGQTGPTSSTLPQALVTRVTFNYTGGMICGDFGITSAPTGATTQSLSSVNCDQNTGLSRTFLTLGQVPGVYQVQGGGNPGFCSRVYPVTFNETATQNVNLTVRLNPSEVPPSLLDHVTYSNTTVIVHAADGQGNPVANQTVNLTAQAVRASGGHDGPDHGGNRPAGSFSGNTCATNTNGDCVLSNGSAPVYSASAFGGLEVLQAQDGSEMVTSTLTVAVASLQSFPAAPSLYPFTQWTLTGQTTKFHKCPNESNHPSNHETTPATQRAIISAIYQFFLDNNIKVGINDMSLPGGGLFDICGGWASPHICHRTGASVDIDFKVNSPVANTFSKYMFQQGAKRVLEGKSLHYQFPSNESLNPICAGVLVP